MQKNFFRNFASLDRKTYVFDENAKIMPLGHCFLNSLNSIQLISNSFLSKAVVSEFCIAVVVREPYDNHTMSSMIRLKISVWLMVDATARRM